MRLSSSSLVRVFALFLREIELVLDRLGRRAARTFVCLDRQLRINRAAGQAKAAPTDDRVMVEILRASESATGSLPKLLPHCYLGASRKREPPRSYGAERQWAILGSNQ